MNVVIIGQVNIQVERKEYMKKLNKRTELVNNTIEAFSVRACGCSCGCDCGCDCSNTYPSTSTRSSGKSDFMTDGLEGPRNRVA